MLRALVAVVVLAVACEAWWLVDQWFALRVFRSTHVVYFLTDTDGRVLYVGSTNDWARRLAEHTSHDEPAEWRTRIHDIVRVRHCRSQRQARRIERRMIGALVDGGRWRLCPPVHNVLLAGRSPLPSVSRLFWLAAYWMHGVCWPACRWHRPNLCRSGPNPANVDITPFPANFAGWPTPQVDENPQTDPVITDDSPQEGPFRDPPAADESAGDDDAQAAPEPDSVRPPLRVVPAGEEVLPIDPAARRREQNRLAQQRRRQKVAAEKQAADA